MCYILEHDDVMSCL